MDTLLNKSISESELNKTPPNTYLLNTKKRRMNDTDNLTYISLKEDMKEIMNNLFSKQEQELKKISLSQSEIKRTIENFEKSVSFLTAQNEEFKKKIGYLEGQVKEDRKYIVTLEDKLEELQKDRRKSSFEISNVPRKNSESKNDLVEMVLHLSNTVNCKLENTDIKDIYRVRQKSRDTANTKIIVETTSTLQKAELLKMCKSFNIRHKTKLHAKHLGFHTLEETPIYISEHLTPKASRLYFLARDLARSKRYKFCWSSFGKVYLRSDENSAIINIRSESQIQSLLQEA